MTPSDRDSYCQYRLEKAAEAYGAAELLVANSQWNAAVNRYAIWSMLWHRKQKMPIGDQRQSVT